MVQLRFSRARARWSPVVLAALGLGLWGTSAARSELKVCNQTLNVYNVAIGYYSGTMFFTEGWWTLPANACVRPLKEDLGNRYYYFFAMDLYGNDATGGDKSFCVDVNKYFRIPTSETLLERPACWLRGFQQVKFQEIDTGGDAVNWTVFVTQQGE